MHASAQASSHGSAEAAEPGALHGINLVKSPAFDRLLMFQVRSSCGSVSAPGIVVSMPGLTGSPLTVQFIEKGVT